MLDERTQSVIHSWKQSGQRIVFTNGCFDILHEGHLEYLQITANLGDRLIIGLNSDASVSRLKGHSRPINKLSFRQRLLSSLRFVDLVLPFEQDTPASLIEAIRPDVLVKGGDYTKQEIVGADFVESYGGSVIIVPFVDGYSSSQIIKKILRMQDK